LKLFFNISKA